MQLKTAKKYGSFCVLLCVLLCYSTSLYSQLIADFIPSNTGGCSPVAINFTNTSTGTSATSTYSWNFGNGNTSTLVNPGAVYTNEGTYTITLTVRDGAQVSVHSKNITVYANPVVDFSASVYKGCLPLEVNFMANAAAGSGTIKNYYWDFGDGNTKQETAAPVTHRYTSSADMAVSLTVTNSYGCTKTFTKDERIKVLPAITANFAAEKTNICKLTDLATFNNLSSGPGTLTYQWDFGDGGRSTQNNPSHSYSRTGSYTVSLTVNSSEGCSAFSSIPNYINAANFRTNFSVPFNICSNSPHLFNNTSNPLITKPGWYINNIFIDSTTSLSHRFPDTGTYSIKLVNNFEGCPDSLTRSIVVKKTPVVDQFILNQNGVCGAPLQVSVEDTSAETVRWTWYFEYPNLRINASTQKAGYEYKTDGIYTIWLTGEAANGCRNAASKRLEIIRPTVRITSKGIPSNCGPYNIQFSTSINVDSIVQYNWDFGDGTFSTDSTPIHLFSNPGMNTVLLRYTTYNGCTGTATSTPFVVTEIPTASFTANKTTVCGNTAVTFSALPQEGVSYHWNFGDGIKITAGNEVQHNYQLADSFTVSLIVSTINGCADTLTRQKYITVLPPFAKISKTQGSCEGSRNHISFSSTASGTNQLLWNFGDGTTLTTNANPVNITHTYAKSGRYRVMLTASNPECVVTDTITINVLSKQKPVLTAVQTTLCGNEQLEFSLTGLEPNPSALPGQNHYNITKIEYEDGTEFTGTFHNHDSTATNWTTYLNGSIRGLDKEKRGIRFILQPTGSVCADTSNMLSYTIKWNHPGFNITDNNICMNEQVIFTDTTTANMQVEQRSWITGDGNISTILNSKTFSYTYSTPGNYTVQLAVKDSSGCESLSAPATIVVNGPKADFIAPAVAYISLPVSFNNNSDIFTSSTVKYQWAFGDRGVSTEESPEFTYSNPGNYKVSLIATDPLTGCSDTAIRSIAVENFRTGFTLSKFYLSPNNCPPLLAVMQNNSINYSSIFWDFGDGTSAENLENPSHIYYKPGIYTITLHVYGPDGLLKTHSDTVSIKGPEAIVTANRSTICANEEVRFTASSKNAVSYTWDFGDGTLMQLSDSSISHLYNTPGIYKPLLIITDITGCQASPELNENIVIHPRPVVQFSPASPQVCRGTAITLTASGGSTYVWDAAEGINSTTNTAALNISPGQDITYSVTAISQQGCTTKDSVFVKVIQPSFIQVAPVQPACINTPVQLNASGMHSYVWTGNTAGLSNTTIASPTAINATPGLYTYTVKGTDISGCFTDTASVIVSALPLPQVKIAPIEGVLFGGSVQLNTTGSSNISGWQWEPATYLDCSTCANPVSTPAAITTYKLIVTDNNGCKNSDEITVKFLCGAGSIMAPTAFTPNGDGLNDVFMLRGISNIEWMQIYDRLGNLVFEKKNFYTGDNSNGWRGDYKGKPAAQGTYTYFAQIRCETGYKFLKKGTITLIR
ncbi:MAG TPA: PKD domain-containing protein [Ferruginibacter sp.]|nr:PKD domain-containing protein [Ferruginibacter sp.]HMP21489.1 PKD domain-containing protein [Ferruginibacter sp.]